MSFRIRKWPSVAHSYKGEKLVEHIIGIDGQASAPKIIEGELPLDNQWREVETHGAALRFSSDSGTDKRSSESVRLACDETTFAEVQFMGVCEAL